MYSGITWLSKHGMGKKFLTSRAVSSSAWHTGHRTNNRLKENWKRKFSVQLLRTKKQYVHSSQFTSPLSSTLHQDAGHASYEQVFRSSVEDPESVWAEAAQRITWFKQWTKTMDNSNPPFTKWFAGGKLNICYNALDRHVENGRGDQVAVIHDSPVTDTKQNITYKEVHEEVSRLAGVLVKHGIGKGDRVVIYMPMIPQAMYTMLACARIGAIHSLIFGGFAPKELSVRIDHAKPKLIVTASFGIEPGRRVEYIPLVDRALEMVQHKPQKVLIYSRPNMERVSLTAGRDLDWSEEIASARPHDCVAVSSGHPLYVLYTSGTTGLPKGKPIGTPDASAYFRVLSEHSVAAMFTAPTAVRAIRQQDPEADLGKKYSLEKFRTLFVAGERCDVETLEWAKKIFKVPVLDHWWQTETGSPITAACIGLGNSVNPPAGQAGKPVPGYNVKVLDNNMQEVKPNTLGNIVVKLPLPPGAFSTLWKNEDLFKDLYFRKFPGFYDTMDAGYKDENGYVYVLSRVDDVINVAGHRLSAGAIEESVMLHNAVADCAVVGLEDPLKGHVPLALCVLRKGVDKTESQLEEEIVTLVREHIGPVAAFRKVLIIKQLPKTRSGKIPRSTLSALVNGRPYTIGPTIEDPAVFRIIEDVVGSKLN
uniref:Acyl-CoA synthetase short-chain family member 3, mitochondrial n=1 Tax=Leptobrachium leishanense TaxID=445787 RepID=A0A8C5Q811_9ANUR